MSSFSSCIVVITLLSEVPLVPHYCPPSTSHITASVLQFFLLEIHTAECMNVYIWPAEPVFGGLCMHIWFHACPFALNKQLDVSVLGEANLPISAVTICLWLPI